MLGDFHRSLGLLTAPLLALNHSYVLEYAGFKDSLPRTFINDQVISVESLRIDEIANLSPWEREGDASSPYVLPPWGLTVDDFVVTRQMPLSSGQREVLLSSPSTGSEQKLFISLPNTPNFQLYGMEFNRVLAAGDGVEFADANSRSLLQKFQVKFSGNEISEVVLADGTKAEFSGGSAVIKSPTDQVIENFQLANNIVPTFRETSIAVNSKAYQATTYNEISEQSIPSTSQPLRLAQSQSACESQVNATASQVSRSIAPWSNQMSQAASDSAKAVGWALGHSTEALNNSVGLDDSVPNIACRPPVQCEERRVSGGSEIRTDLFDIPQGTNGSEVTLRYEFYSIPDSLEMYYDGQQVFSVGPTSGRASKTFNLPASAQQVGVTLRGNDDENTRWWYVVSCDSEAPQCPTEYSDYQEQAFLISNRTSDPVDRNIEITIAYRDMYLSNKNWAKWSGLAAIASNQVGEGIQLLDGISNSWRINPERWGSQLVLLSLSDQATLKGAMADGNKALFEDIYPQHLVYECDGINGIAQFYDEGKIDPAMFKAWQLIDEGDVLAGNVRLTEYEQLMFLQPKVFSPHLSIWGSFTANWDRIDEIATVLGYPDPFSNPIPGGNKGFLEMALLPGETQHNLGNVNQRFRWIKDEILTPFVNLPPATADALVLREPQLDPNRSLLSPHPGPTPQPGPTPTPPPSSVTPTPTPTTPTPTPTPQPVPTPTNPPSSVTPTPTTPTPPAPTSTPPWENN